MAKDDHHFHRAKARQEADLQETDMDHPPGVQQHQHREDTPRRVRRKDIMDHHKVGQDQDQAPNKAVALREETQTTDRTVIWPILQARQHPPYNQGST